MILEIAFIMSCWVHPPGYDYGRASWYGRESSRHRMANGAKFNRHKMTAASYAYPLGTLVEVTNLENGRRIKVEITDRGPARRLARLIDLSEAAASRLGLRSQGMTDISVFVAHYQNP